MGFCIIYTTHPSAQEAKRISDIIVDEKLAACSNTFPITSSYWWQKQIEHDSEWVSILKTIPEHWEALQQRILELHPYQVPCIIKIDVEANEGYEKWVKDSVKEPVTH